MLLAAASALFVSYREWIGRGTYGRGVRLTARAFFDALSLQVLLGLVLYAVSPLVRNGLGDLGAAMAVKELRFFAVEHITGMLVATTLIHVGAVRVKRAPTDRDKLRQTVLWQTLTAATIALSVPWWRPLLRM